MQRAPKLDLNDFVPPWERKLDNLVSETEFDRLLRSDMNSLKRRAARISSGMVVRWRKMFSVR